MNQAFLKAIGHDLHFSKNEITLLASCFQAQQFCKGSILLRPSQKESELRLLEAGIIKAYYYESFGAEKEKQVIKWIAIEGNFATSLTSFLSQTPVNEYIEVLEDCKIFSISIGNWEKIIETYDKFKDLKIKLLQIELERNAQKLEILECTENYNKYSLFRKYHPKLVGRINELEKANFLKMSRDTLNEVRKKYNE